MEGTLGNDLRVEFKAVGDTVNMASRMEGLAEPGSPYVSEDTFKLTEGLFRFEVLGDYVVKGKKESLKAYRVSAPSTSRTRFDVSAEQGLKILGAEESSMLPYLLELLSVRDSGVDKISLSPEVRKDRIIEALKRISLKASEIRSLIMAIENLHWIDKSSEDVFKSLLDRITGARVL